MNVLNFFLPVTVRIKSKVLFSALSLTSRIAVAGSLRGQYLGVLLSVQVLEATA